MQNSTFSKFRVFEIALFEKGNEKERESRSDTQKISSSFAKWQKAKKFTAFQPHKVKTSLIGVTSKAVEAVTSKAVPLKHFF